VAGTILEAYNIIGCVHIRKGEYNKAKDVFMYAIELYEDKIGEMNSNWSMSLETYISMYYNVGLCDFYMGNFIKAIHTFATIKKTLPYKLESLEMIMTTIKKIIIIK
jgi:tetratricopeptide (TPR) repeat protein